MDGKKKKKIPFVLVIVYRKSGFLLRYSVGRIRVKIKVTI